MDLKILTIERKAGSGPASRTLFIGNNIPQGIADELILSLESFIETKMGGGEKYANRMFIKH